MVRLTEECSHYLCHRSAIKPEKIHFVKNATFNIKLLHDKYSQVNNTDVYTYLKCFLSYPQLSLVMIVLINRAF